MASTTPKESHSIENIEMDAFGVTTDLLATKGVIPCICFVVILEDGCELFLEHRNDPFLPPTIITETICLCLHNLAQHVSDVSPSSRIS
jgi:hypothetical protein